MTIISIKKKLLSDENINLEIKQIKVTRYKDLYILVFIRKIQS